MEFFEYCEKPNRPTYSFYSLTWKVLQIPNFWRKPHVRENSGSRDIGQKGQKWAEQLRQLTDGVIDGVMGSKMNVLQQIFNLVHQISMKLSGNVLDIIRIKTDEFGNMFARSCPDIFIIQAQIRPYLVPKYAVFKISRIWFIRFR